MAGRPATRRHGQKRGIAALLLAAAALLPAGAEAADAPAAARTLVIGVSQFPSRFHPFMDPAVSKSYVLAMARRPLVTFDADWALVCLLCTRVPTLENGGAVRETTPDGKAGVAVTYTLLDGLRWGDGAPLTTRDLVFAWQVGRHPASGVIPRELYRSLWRMEVTDERTVTLHFDKLTFDYNAITAFEPLPAHLEEAAFADPGAYHRASRYETDTTNPGLYNGPFLIENVSSGSAIMLTRNPHWSGIAPAFERVVVRVIGNTAALEANLIAGGIHMIAGELGLTLDQAVAFERRAGERFQFLHRPSLGYEHIDFNLDNPLLADRRVRQALLLAIDRPAISDALFDGRQPVAGSPLNPLDPMAATDLPAYPVDPARAAALLDAAGWRREGNGIRRDAAGRALTLELMTTAGDRTREAVQQVLQSQWREIGVDVRLRNQPARIFFGETVTRRRFPAMAMYAFFSAPGAVPRTVLHSEQIPSAENNYAGQNYTGFRNAEADDLIERLEVTLNEDERRALWRELQVLYMEELPALPLYFRANAFVLPKDMRGLRPTGHQFPSTLWIEHWRPG